MSNFDLSIKEYSIAAGGWLRLHIPADFFQIMEATGNVSVDFLKSSSRIGRAESVGQGFRLGPLVDEFHGVEIYSATAQTLKLCFSKGNSPVDLSQVVSVTGTVSVINGEESRVLNGSAFAGVSNSSAAASLYCHTQLWNPAASGVHLYVNRAALFIGVAGSIYIGKNTTALATLRQNGTNKRLGAANGIGECRTENTGAILISLSERLQSVAMPAGETKEVPFSEPILVEPGNGLVVAAVDVNVGFATSFQWIEKVI